MDAWFDELKIAERENEELKAKLLGRENEFKYFTNSFKLKIKKLKQQIEKMKCCANCKYGNSGDYDSFENCRFCTVMYCICDKTKKEMDWEEKCDKWELAE